MYRILDQINDYMAASSPVLEMTINDDKYPDAIVNEVHANHGNLRSRFVEGINLKILGLSGNVFVITEAGKNDLAGDVFYKISNGVEWMTRWIPYNKDSPADLPERCTGCSVQRGLYEPDGKYSVDSVDLDKYSIYEVMDSPYDFVFLRWFAVSVYARKGFKYELVKRDMIPSMNLTSFATNEEIELVHRCCDLGRGNRMSRQRGRCTHCGEYNYVTVRGGPIVFPCLRCGKLFVYEKNARALNIDPTLGRLTESRKSRWDRIEIGG